ncbi:hypothetical protein CKA55_06785 [Arcobacter suis]|uniref:Type IV methyl-directed restriction system, component McrB n=1 Tax=Arcobacter suis CECT 7833 TaxID=663365 RepID=A0AAD0WQA9_9BACT|nr:AAA family ATPase [Arcobacter suis]AXX89610.1 type IV methyl-directed restriction system, component McrB [Arcobacter suis CECT 7833]RWS46709.1 hypothetical protein CKA55_06785 [Arcobacter suis]
MDRKELFREWLKNNGMSASVQSNYPLYIDEYIPAILKGINLEVNSLFEITDLKKLEDILNKIQIDLKEINLEKSSFPSASLKKYIEYIKSSYKISKDEKYNMKTKNIMLYGAPGVGKTHNYKRLITMIEDGNDEKTIFDTISKNEITNDFDNSIFEDIKKEKRIEFVTFHQSYSYEDFIEGFRPNEEGKLELEDGILKKTSQDAEVNLKKSEIDIEKENINLDELILKFTNYVQDSLDNDKEFSLEKKVTVEGINNKNAFLLGGSIKSAQRLTPDIIKRDYEDFKDGYIAKYEDVKPTRESKSTYHGNARYYFMLYKKIYEFEKSLNINEIKQEKENLKNFYIVIDEINRGNISKIFGELITLIEEDKRGKKEYEVTLPYSKKPFLIPENLYIIATMNSTDKSIATIDIALRRRFTFLKMKPNLDLVPEIAKVLFEKINEHISKTINEDYKLGHSYFMNIVDDKDLEFVKKYKIQPLLEEYFYGDEENYKKAIAILNIKEDNQ